MSFIIYCFVPTCKFESFTRVNKRIGYTNSFINIVLKSWLNLISVMPRPVVGQNAVMKRARSPVREDGELGPIVAEMLRQQALYEHLCGVYLSGQLPVPPIFKPYSPPVGNISLFHTI